MHTLGILAALVWIGISGDVMAASLQTVTVERHTIDEEQHFDAVLEAVHRTTVSAQTSGQILKILFDVDDYVEKDAVIIEINDTEQRAAMQEASAQYTEAQINFQRIEDLLAKDLASRAEHDRARAVLQGADAGLKWAREQLNYTQIRAPYSGIVTNRHAEPGETVAPGKPLMTGISLERMRAVARVSQQHINGVRQISRAHVLLPGDDGRRFEGTGLTVSPYADPVSHTFFVRVEMQQGIHGLYPGMFAKVAIITGQRQGLLVPLQAVVHRSEVTAVYVVRDDGSITMRQIRIGRKHKDLVEVLAGLDVDEKIALDPTQATVLLKQQRAGQ